MRIALVIPWYGRDLKGGAESHAWQVATRLAARGVSVTVLTTCAGQFLDDWSTNRHEPGESAEDGVGILRFPVKGRDVAAFDALNARLLSIPHSELNPSRRVASRAEERVFLRENIYSPALMEYLRKHRRSYDAFLFLPYLFPSSVEGVGLVGERAILQPCLHNEVYAYFDCVANAFHEAGALFFISRGEMSVAERLFGDGIKSKSFITGGGVEFDDPGCAVSRSPVESDYVLCLGRRDTGKGTHVAIKAFDEFSARSGSALKLVLAGPGALPVVPASRNVVDLGLVSGEDKKALLTGCKALVNPSSNESFSRVVYEAWFAGKPVIVNSECPATLAALEDSGGAGWAASGVDGFGRCFELLDKASSDALAEMGRLGAGYARRTASWDTVIDGYEKLLVSFKAANDEASVVSQAAPVEKSRPRVVITYLALIPFDAVCNDMMAERQALVDAGFDASIYAPSVHESCREFALDREEFERLAALEDTILLYHHANFWEEGGRILEAAKCRKWMKYHNVTPGVFFQRLSDTRHIGDACDKGRAQTADLVRRGFFSRCLADSAYNGDELAQLGVPRDRIFVSPPMHKLDEMNEVGMDMAIVRRLAAEGRMNILFVGRLCPNKGHRSLIETMRRLRNLYNLDVVLHFVGSTLSHDDLYLAEIRRVIAGYGLKDRVLVSGLTATPGELLAYYASADAFLLMSEHEGFCVPILEAQCCHVPVVALDRGAVRGTLGFGQVILENLDYTDFAAALKIVLEDRAARVEIERSGFKNFKRYGKAKLAEEFLRFFHDPGNPL